MGVLKTQITALHSIGADAMDNLYDVDITLPQIIIDNIAANKLGSPELIQTHFRLRSEGFTPPKFTQKKYEVRYKTVGMNRPAARVDGERSFQITFRVDAYYLVYHALLAWRSLLFEPSVGYASPALPSARDIGSDAEAAQYFGQISVATMISPPIRRDSSYASPGITEGIIGTGSGNGNLTPVDNWDAMDENTQAFKAWEFQQVWISDLTEPEFQNGSGEIQKVTATFDFGEYKSPSTEMRSRV